MSKKIVIVFEGIEGSGKTFHIKHVSRKISKEKRESASRFNKGTRR